MARVEVVPVQRAELVTQDMELLAERVRQLYVDHAGRFRCDDPAQIDGQVCSVTAGELGAGLLRYGGVRYQAEVEPIGMPTATRAFPSDHRMASSGITSIRSVGFERGSKIGRSTPAQRALITSSVKAP